MEVDPARFVEALKGQKMELAIGDELEIDGEELSVIGILERRGTQDDGLRYCLVPKRDDGEWNEGRGRWVGAKAIAKAIAAALDAELGGDES